MKILAVEFSSAQRSAAVLETEGHVPTPPGRDLSIPSPHEVGRGLGRRVPRIETPADPDASAAKEHGNLGLVERALAQANCRREEIGVVAVGLGPGSNTGIRSAIALAQGWQLGRAVQTLGVSSVECLAAQAAQTGLRGPVNIVIDAQRNEFYLARYQIDESGWREVEPLRLAASSEIQAMAETGGTLLGPDISRWFPAAKNMNPEAAMLARLACGRRDYIPAEKLEPIYLREPAFKKAPVPRIIP